MPLGHRCHPRVVMLTVFTVFLTPIGDVVWYLRILTRTEMDFDRKIPSKSRGRASKAPASRQELVDQLHKDREARGRDKRLVTAATRVQACYRQAPAAMSRTSGINVITSTVYVHQRATKALKL